MSELNRRRMLGGVALGVGSTLAVRAASAAGSDGHAGYDVAPAAGVPVLPRKPADPVRFTCPLDDQPPKATSGGWAREVTSRTPPISTGIAGAHLYINAGGAREMHWHATAAEWAYVLAGRCQVTVLDPEGHAEIVNFAPGDVWYFPKGHSHSIQTIGTEPCHAILAFDDGLYGEHGTFGISDWLSLTDPALRAQNFGLPEAAFAGMPKGETYIMQGEVIPLDSPRARMVDELPIDRTHRYQLMAQPAYRDLPGGSIHVASARQFPMSATMASVVIRLKPGALQELHWHPNAAEWFYVSRGRVQATLFVADKHLASADMQVGDCGYIPQGFGHSLRNNGTEECEIVGVMNDGRYQESSLTEWVARAPRHLLANNFGVPETALPAFPNHKVTIAGG